MLFKYIGNWSIGSIILQYSSLRNKLQTIIKTNKVTYKPHRKIIIK